PDSAVQVIDRSDAKAYRILARVYCTGDAACRALREETAQMAAPEPATDADSASYAAWQAVVMREACTPGPKEMQAPMYPASLARNGEGGHVELRLLVNPCGEVRAVRLGKTSGFPQLDQVTINKAWRWRLYAERQAEGAVVRVPVDFVPPELEGAPSSRVDRTAR
ncbi:MAG TPA: TonB family protein, partial [Lysobacter sp.]